MEVIDFAALIKQDRAERLARAYRFEARLATHREIDTTCCTRSSRQYKETNRSNITCNSSWMIINKIRDMRYDGIEDLFDRFNWISICEDRPLTFSEAEIDYLCYILNYFPSRKEQQESSDLLEDKLTIFLNSIKQTEIENWLPVIRKPSRSASLSNRLLESACYITRNHLFEVEILRSFVDLLAEVLSICRQLKKQLLSKVEARFKGHKGAFRLLLRLSAGGHFHLFSSKVVELLSESLCLAQQLVKSGRDYVDWSCEVRSLERGLAYG